jgi:DNA-binding CsgD family transcriptional regulator/tetratricopeptide (TPR) repeat protein
MQPAAIAELLERRGAECHLIGEADEAITAFERALAIHRRGNDQRQVANTLSSLVAVMHDAGRAPAAESLATEATELAEPLGPSRELARAYAARAQLCMVFADLEGTVDWGERAIKLAERLNETEILVHALTSVGPALVNAGRHEGRDYVERALQLALEAAPDGAAARAFNNLVSGGLRTRDYDVAERYVQEGIEFAEEHGLDLWLDLLRASQLMLDLDRGRWRRAADTATELLAAPGTRPSRVEALVTIGRVRARYGDPGPREALDEARALADSIREPQDIMLVAVARAEAAWLNGKRAEEVGEATNDTMRLALECGDAWRAGELGWWRWQAGLSDEIAPEQMAEPYRLSIAGDWAGAAELWTAKGCPYEAALALAESDDPVHVRNAINQLQQLGAKPAAAIIGRRLRQRGVRGIPRGPRSQTRENPAGLTARELEVLALLVEGLRNAQIAERLVVSQKTVDHHVSAILRKLGARTRGEAVAEAARLALISSP